LKKIANNLKLRKEVLAVEWLDKKKLFGDKASIEEMSAFKSRVKKQEIVYDPEKEQALEEERKKQEMENVEKEVERIKKTGKVKTPVPFEGT